MVLRRLIRAENEEHMSSFWNVYKFGTLPAPFSENIDGETDDKLNTFWESMEYQERREWYFSFQSVGIASYFIFLKTEYLRCIAVKPGPENYRECDTQTLFHENARVDTQPLNPEDVINA